MLARKPWAVDLCRELDLELVAPRTAGALVVTGSGLLPLPSGPFGISTDVFEMATWPGLSIAGRLRAAADLARPRRRSTGDESLGSLLRRRLGDEVVEVLLAPLLGGLWAGDVDRLSAVATFPELVAWERRSGSLLRGARAAAASPRASAIDDVRVRARRARAPDHRARGTARRARAHRRAGDLGRTVRPRPRRPDVGGGGSAGAVVLATPAPVSPC
jgi:protoporphyrinogen oxidase